MSLNEHLGKYPGHGPCEGAMCLGTQRTVEEDGSWPLQGTGLGAGGVLLCLMLWRLASGAEVCDGLH